MSLVPKVTQTANAEIEKRDASGGRNGRESGAVKLISHCSFYVPRVSQWGRVAQLMAKVNDPDEAMK